MFLDKLFQHHHSQAIESPYEEQSESNSAFDGAHADAHAATQKREIIYSPLQGQLVALSAVNDPVFASESMGKGVAIKPQNGAVYSPVDGSVALVAYTKHALCLLSNSGAEILVHLGIDTVELNGAPFTMHVSEGDTVTKGQLLMELNLPLIIAASKDNTCMVIITNSDAYNSIKCASNGAVSVGEELITLS